MFYCGLDVMLKKYFYIVLHMVKTNVLFKVKKGKMMSIRRQGSFMFPLVMCF